MTAMPSKMNQRAIASAASDAGKFEDGIVAECAYHLWLSRGCPDGNADEIWFEAQKLLRANGAEVPDMPTAPARSSQKTPKFRRERA